jgi:hypothetical protein
MKSQLDMYQYIEKTTFIEISATVFVITFSPYHGLDARAVEVIT